MRRTSLALTLIAPAAFAAEMPIRGVTLSSAGIAQIERAGAFAATSPALRKLNVPAKSQRMRRWCFAPRLAMWMICCDPCSFLILPGALKASAYQRGIC